MSHVRRLRCAVASLVVVAFLLSTPLVGAARFVRGDVDGNSLLQITDAVQIFGFLFRSRPPTLRCMDAADVDDNRLVQLNDGVFLLNSLFRDGPPPPAPFPQCDHDPTDDDLTCEVPHCSENCSGMVAAIAEETGIVGSCSAVVRLTYVSREITGWQLVCGGYDFISEEAARARAQEDTGFGATARMLNPPDPEDSYVFYTPPGDFGGVGVVSARNGLAVFGGSIIWLGSGELTHPADWRPPETLGQCSSMPLDFPAVGYDLVLGDADSRMAEADVEAALDVVRRTALVEALATSGYVFDAVVLSYPRAVGAFDPRSAEWIVIINAGWLE